ncbi:carbonic anhydrase 9-like [Meleagris gallopavo]|uniref:carbonic anhydrase 9-like n=1 Tax=Meleagris gallopavo TaxID=9103 RepID=UPI0012ABE4F3|nr:carbonic anhydrase 9-like [Meleagris gallopavo]
MVLKLPESLAIVSGYVQPYRAMQLLLHWGLSLKPGSEHTVDHKHFAGEVGPRKNPYYQQILEHLHSIQGEGNALLALQRKAVATVGSVHRESLHSSSSPLLHFFSQIDDLQQ